MVRTASRDKALPIRSVSFTCLFHVVVWSGLRSDPAKNSALPHEHVGLKCTCPLIRNLAQRIAISSLPLQHSLSHERLYTLVRIDAQADEP